MKSTLSFGSLYKQAPSFVLSGFIDPDSAGNVNDKCSTTGLCFDIGSGTISWCSKKQSFVALSSCEVEYIAATMTTQECFAKKAYGRNLSQFQLSTFHFL